ncbi:hypothetical protein [Streptomyces sp. NPDC001450]
MSLSSRSAMSGQAWSVAASDPCGPLYAVRDTDLRDNPVLG